MKSQLQEEVPQLQEEELTPKLVRQGDRHLLKRKPHFPQPVMTLLEVVCMHQLPAQKGKRLQLVVETPLLRVVQIRQRLALKTEMLELAVEGTSLLAVAGMHQLLILREERLHLVLEEGKVAL